MLNNLSTGANLLWATLESLILIGGGFKFFFTMKRRLDDIERYTYKRNGGSSIADSQARQEERFTRIEKALDENTALSLELIKGLSKLEGKFSNHIDELK